MKLFLIYPLLITLFSSCSIKVQHNTTGLFGTTDPRNLGFEVERPFADIEVDVFPKLLDEIRLTTTTGLKVKIEDSQDSTSKIKAIVVEVEDGMLKKVDAKFVQKLAKIEKRKIIISEKNLSGCKSNFFSLIQRKSVILNKKISEQKTYFTTNEFVKNNKTPTCVEEVVLALNPNKPVNVYINNVKVYGENLSDDQFTSSLEYYDSSDKLKHSIRYLKSNFTGVRFINLLDEVSSSNQMDFINEIFSEETKKINIELVEQTLNKVSSSYHIDTINAMIDSVNNQNSAQTLISLLNIISSSNQVEVLNIFITRNKLSQSQSSSEMIRLLNLFYSSDQQKVIANLVDNKLIQSPLAVNEIISFIDLGSSVYMLETLESLLPIIDKEQLSKSDVKLIADQFSSFDQADVYEILL